MKHTLSNNQSYEVYITLDIHTNLGRAACEERYDLRWIGDADAQTQMLER